MFVRGDDSDSSGCTMPVAAAGSILWCGTLHRAIVKWLTTPAVDAARACVGASRRVCCFLASFWPTISFFCHFNRQLVLSRGHTTVQRCKMNVYHSFSIDTATRVHPQARALRAYIASAAAGAPAQQKLRGGGEKDVASIRMCKTQLGTAKQ